MFYVKNKLVERVWGEIGRRRRIAGDDHIRIWICRKRLKGRNGGDWQSEEYEDRQWGRLSLYDPQTGQILAMVGSRGWDDPDYDGQFNVTMLRVSRARAIKPGGIFGRFA